VVELVNTNYPVIEEDKRLIYGYLAYLLERTKNEYKKEGKSYYFYKS